MPISPPSFDQSGGYAEIAPGVLIDQFGNMFRYVRKPSEDRDAFGNLIGGTETKLVEVDAAERKRILNALGLTEADLGTNTTGGTGTRLAADDPRYWANIDRQYQLDLMQLEQQYMNMGLDAEAARRQALATLITNRNNTAVDVANISNDVAKTAAQFAANPRDAVAELFYRNQVGGSTPFGDLANDNFGQYGKTLAEKAASIFSPVAADLQQARVYRDSIPPVDFFGPEQRQQLGLPLAPQQQPFGAGLPQAPATPMPPVNPLVTMTDKLNAMNPLEQWQFRNYVTGGEYGKTNPVPKMDMGGVVNARTGIGEAPTSSEGGLNINLFEPAMVVGMDSGRVYATVAEPRPDGTRRGEQLVVKPLKSEVEKDKQQKGQVTQSFGVSKMAQGGQVNALSTPDDFMEQLRQYLGGLGGSGGGVGSYESPLPGLRMLAGDPWSSLEDDPVAMDYALAGYSALGIDPRTVAATVRKFTPQSAQRVGQTNVRTSF